MQFVLEVARFIKIVWFYAGDSHLLLPSSVVIDGRPLNFLNDLDIDSDGNIYFTDTSRYQRRDFVLDLVDSRGTGRLESASNKIVYIFNSVTSLIWQHVGNPYYEQPCLQPQCIKASFLNLILLGLSPKNKYGLTVKRQKFGIVVTRAPKTITFLNRVNRTIVFFNRMLITVLMHILFVTFFILFVLHLQVDIVGPLPLNTSLLLALTTDYSDWLVQVTEIINNDGVFFSFDDCVIE